MKKYFDPKVQLGHIIQLGGVIILAIVLYNKLEWRVTSLENSYMEMKKISERLSDVVLRLTIIEEDRKQRERGVIR